MDERKAEDALTKVHQKLADLLFTGEYAKVDAKVDDGDFKHAASSCGVKNFQGQRTGVRPIAEGLMASFDRPPQQRYTFARCRRAASPIPVFHGGARFFDVLRKHV
ncbi:unnamed protein product [Symbiodinium natans]|uniref:Uncharacterized protein n=1 Tax=Symbiodinium natans TaxID=878477 RepID=A0A812NEQ9_9DINO|nr:unnamed protein product [Symbiodinium natans]